MTRPRSNRVRIRFTARGHLFAGICIALYFAALTSQSGLLLFLIGLIVGCSFINAVMASRSVAALELTAPEQTHVSEGERLSEPWQITNNGKKPAGLVAVLQGKSTLIKAPLINAGQKISAAPSLQFQRRGVYPLSKVRLLSSHPFGLMRASRELGLKGEVIVYPAIYPAPVVPAAGFDTMLGGKHRGIKRSLSGANFAGVRKLEPGDPLRIIHWKSSSKGQGLMVKTFDEELSGRVCFLVDTISPRSPDALDDCLRAAGSLMFAALDEGHHIEWIDLGTAERRVVPPFADGHELLGDLARIQAGATPLTEERLKIALEKASRRSSLCFVLQAPSPVIDKAMDQLVAQRRIVSVCLPARSGSRAKRGYIYTAASVEEAAP